MAGMLDYLMGPQENQLARIGGALTSGMNAFQTEQDRLRTLAQQEAERKRLAAERERTHALETFKLQRELGKDALSANDPTLASQRYAEMLPAAEKLGIKMTPMVGGLRGLSNTEAAAMPGNVEDLFSYDAQGNFRPAVQDYSNPQSQARMAGAFGYTPTLKGFNRTDDVLDEQGNLVRAGNSDPTGYQQRVLELRQQGLEQQAEATQARLEMQRQGVDLATQRLQLQQDKANNPSTKTVNFKTWLENNTDETLPKIMTPQEIDAAVRQDLSAWINGHGMMKPKPANVHRQKNQLTTKYQQQNEGEKARLTRLRQQYRGQGGTDDGNAQPASAPAQTGGGSQFMTEFQKLMAPALKAVGKLPAR